MATKALEKFQEQLKSIKDNEAFTKSDTNKDLKKVRQNIKQMVSSISSSIKGKDIYDAQAFLEEEVIEMRILNDMHLKVKAIDRLIDRVELHGNKYITALEKNQDKEILKVAKKHISTSKKSSKDEKELAKLKEMDYFTCSESDCSCNDVFLCGCSESDCSCSESDNEIDEKTVKRLRKLNRQLRASNKKEKKEICNKSVCFRVPSKLAQAEVVFDDDTDSASSSEDFDYESFKSLLKQSNTRLENMSDSSKISMVFKNLKTMYNKLSYTNRNKFTSQMELLDALYN